jgi:hypothetical protein
MATLQSIINNGISIPLSDVSSDSELVKEIQEKLGKIGFVELSSITLGKFDPLTEGGLGEFRAVSRQLLDNNIDKKFASVLIDVAKDILVLPTPAAITIKLSGQVGRNKTNNPNDVLAIKTRLADLGFKVARDSVFDNTTDAAIRLFQAIINRLDEVNRVDGIVDVGGKTNKALEQVTAPVWQEMPPGSVKEGFLNHDNFQQDNSDYGTSWMVETVQAAAKLYKANYLSSHPNATLIATNDMSKSTGGIHPKHMSHQVGMCCDIRLPRKDGTAGGISYTDPAYDRSAMKAMLESFKNQSKHTIRRVFFNDMTLIVAGLCREQPGHDDHAHIDILAP